MGIFKKTSIFLVFILISITSAGQPAILSHPSDTSVCNNVTVEFNITASNAVFYQWQEFDGSGWFDIGDDITYAEGENTPTLILSDVITGMNGYKYRCYVEDAQGENAMSNSATLNVYDNPLITAHPQDKEVCKNQTAIFSIQAETVTNYQWQENRGNGWYNLSDNAFYSGSQTNELQIFTIFGIDDYLYRCKVFNNSCSAISEEAMLQVNALPQVYFVYGGGEICENEPGVEVFLNDSEQGVNYELIRNDELTVAVREGTGEEISFGLQNTAGTYIVRAVNSITACQNMMNGQADIAVDSAPEGFDLVGTGVFCEGSTGTTLFLQGSETGVNYSLLLDGNPTGYLIEGTGGTLSFIDLSTEGSYSVRAENQLTGCTGFMNNTLELTAEPAPEVYSLTGEEIFCGDEGAVLHLSGSEVGVAYRLLLDGQPSGDELQGTGNALAFEGLTNEGLYSVRAVHNNTGCENMMNGEVDLQIAEAPEVFTLSGPSYLCDNESGFLSLSGSQQAVVYEVLRNGQPTGNSLYGNGDMLTFVIQESGAYQVLATETENGCTTVMNGQAVVQQQSTPFANAGPDKEIQTGGTAVLEGSATGGTGQYNYQWQPQELLQNANLQQPQTVAMEAPQLFTLQVEDAVSGCFSENDSVFVTLENGAFTVQAYVSDDSLCAGEISQLYALVQGGTGDYSFYWYTQDGTFSSAQPNPVVSPQESTEYIIRVDDGQTIVEDTISIFVNQVPEIYSLTGDEGFCSGSEGALLTLSGAQPNTTYQVFRNGMPYGLYLYGGSMTVQQGGTYTVMATRGGCGQPMDGVVEIEEYVTPTANAGDDKVLAVGQATTLVAGVNGTGPDFVYQWMPPDLLEEPQQQVTSTVPLYASAEFALKVTDAVNGCESRPDSVDVTVSGEGLILSVAASGDTVCPATTVSLSALASGGNGAYSYNWTSVPQGFHDFDSLAQPMPLQNTTYFITVSDGNYSVTDSVEVVMAASPQTQTVSGGGGVCAGSPGAEITLDGSETNVYYSLFHEDGDLLNAVSGTGQGLSLGLASQEGSYFVTATHISSSCTKQMNGTPVVFEYDSPQAFAGGDVVIGNGQTADLNGYGTGGSGQFSYFWSPATLVENASSPSTSTVNLSASALFRFEVTDQVSGCTSAPDSVLVSVSGSNLSVLLQSDFSAICQGEEIRLFALASGGSGNYSYSWSSNPPGASGSGYILVQQPETNTAYTVTVDDGENTIEKSVFVSVQESPTANAGEDMQVTYGETAILLGEVSGGSGNYSYQWAPAGLLNGGGNTINAQSVPLFQDVEFTFSVSDNQTGCQSAVDTVFADVTGNALDVKVLSSSGMICSGKEITMASLVSGNTSEVNYQWTSDPAGVNSSSPSLTTQISQGTTFYLEVTDNEGTATDSVTVDVIPSPDLFVLTGNGIYCKGEDGATLSLNDSQDGITYQLLRNSVFTGNELAGDGSTVSYENISQQGYYTAIAINTQNQCSRLMSGGAEVRQEEPPYQFSLEGGGTYCEGEQQQINLTGSEPGVDYYLSFEETVIDTASGNGDNILFNIASSSGDYSIVAKDTTSNCTSEMLNAVNITTNPLPELTVSADTTIYRGGTAVLTASGAEEYQWRTNPVSYGPALQVSPDETTTYEVTGTNEFECEATLSVMVTVEESVLPDVNAFTPNGDGVNDVFREGYQITVFNRWGIILFEGDEGWNGMHEGTFVPPGTYYFVQYTDASGNEIDPPVKGSVTVIRNQN